jgi:mono/diheme cytochrome c family protein
MRILALIGALAIVVAIAAGVFFLGGFFNVAASEEDNPVVKWALIHVRTASIGKHAAGTPPLKLDDPAVIRDGARAFARAGCANCHGAPGVEWAKFSEGLNPDPPDLKENAAGSEPAQIFWVVKNGIRMTGMPSFGKAGVADNDIWQITAFVKALPKVSEADYKSWTAPAGQ